jgi:hypothetical protein
MSATHHDHTVFEIKSGDRLPVLEVHLIDCEGNALDLTPYQDAFLVVSQCVGGRRIVDMAPMAKQVPLTGGIVTYNWAMGDTAVAGEYNVEIVLSPNFTVVPSTDQKLMTLPGGGYGKLRITPRL